MASNPSPMGWAGRHWDSAFYLSIAGEGYERPVSGQLSNLAFFPVYPLLTRLLSGLIGNAVIAGVLVSHLAFLGALLILDRLTLLEFADSSTARRTVSIWPRFQAPSSSAPSIPKARFCCSPLGRSIALVGSGGWPPGHWVHWRPPHASSAL